MELTDSEVKHLRDFIQDIQSNAFASREIQALGGVRAVLPDALLTKLGFKLEGPPSDLAAEVAVAEMSIPQGPISVAYCSWDRKDPAEVEIARRLYDNLVSRGFSAFRVLKKNEQRRPMRKFDGRVERVMFVAPMGPWFPLRQVTEMATSTKQEDKAKKRVKRGGSAAWNRDRMNETHRKGKRKSKKDVRRASRRVGKQAAKAE